MPHISVKLFEGRNSDTKLALAKALQAELAQVLGGEIEHITVSVEDFDLDGWGEVYDREIKGNPHTVLPPSYDWDSEYLRMTGKPRK